MDSLLIAADTALRTLFATPRASEPTPARGMDEGALDPTQKKLAGALMRVNHVGEVCAQALYTAQAAITRDPALQAHLLEAAREETDHLAWTQQRLDALAQERIKAYHADITVLADGSMEVTENITVRAEGSRIRRGIYRDFPTRYKDHLGNRYVVDFEVLGVQRDGSGEVWFTEAQSNGVRVNTGSDAFLPVPADYTFSIRYRTSRQIGFFDEHDELYWNVTGLGWNFPIDHAGATVTLPKPVPAAQLGAEAQTGAYGVRGQDYRAEVRDGGARPLCQRVC